MEVNLFHDYEKAISLAKNEIIDRPTIQSYDLLAWVYYKKSDLKSAINVCQNHLIGRSSEPMILYHIGSILKANRNSVGNRHLKEALEASFELGPVISSEIKNSNLKK